MVLYMETDALSLLTEVRNYERESVGPFTVIGECKCLTLKKTQFTFIFYLKADLLQGYKQSSGNMC